MPELRVVLSSFLVLFLEVALIRWLPAQVRLLSYFANFILLGCFLGIGVGCLLSKSRHNLFAWFPLLLAVLVGAVVSVQIEVAVPTSTEIFFSSGTSGSVLVVESIWFLPVLFALVAGLFAALAQRMAREM
ncbi:MAG: spermidine synthase, partial [Planctomycetes bacterium]|nr:spermidine synthase [Planctomycetota bacterium]